MKPDCISAVGTVVVAAVMLVEDVAAILQIVEDAVMVGEYAAAVLVVVVHLANRMRYLGFVPLGFRRKCLKVTPAISKSY